MKKLKYSWKQFDNDCDSLVRKIKRSKYNPKTIVALARGGLCLGVRLSHRLKKPLLIISTKAYAENKKAMKTVILNSSYTVPLQSPILICDEISDTGITLDILKEHFETLAVEIKTCTLLYKPRTKVKPDYFCKEVANDSWVTFCWEE
jgi:hypoxanthine phosphoribosyltransferase